MPKRFKQVLFNFINIFELIIFEAPLIQRKKSRHIIPLLGDDLEDDDLHFKGFCYSSSGIGGQKVNLNLEI